MWIDSGRQFARFDQLAVHPRKSADDSGGLLAFTQQTVQVLKGGAAIARGENFRELPDRVLPRGNHQRIHISDSDFASAGVQRELFELEANLGGLAVDGISQFSRSVRSDLRAQFAGHLRRERRNISGAYGEFHDESACGEHFEKFFAAVKVLRFHEQRGKWRRIVEIARESVGSAFDGFIATEFKRFGILQNQNLARRKHWRHLRALQQLVESAAAGGNFENAPFARALRNELIDERVAALVAQVRIGAQQNNRGDGLALLDALQKILDVNFGHQNPSSKRATRSEAKSRDMRSMAGPSS